MLGWSRMLLNHPSRVSGPLSLKSMWKSTPDDAPFSLMAVTAAAVLRSRSPRVL